MPFPVDMLYIKQAQEKVGARFPLSYIAYMQRCNGGELKTPCDYWQLHPIFDTSDKKRLARTCNDVVRETQRAADWPGFPRDALVIAENGTGDRLILLKEDQAQQFGPAVYWWDHETGELNFVADDFMEISCPPDTHS